MNPVAIATDFVKIMTKADAPIIACVINLKRGIQSEGDDKLDINSLESCDVIEVFTTRKGLENLAKKLPQGISDVRADYGMEITERLLGYVSKMRIGERPLIQVRFRGNVGIWDKVQGYLIDAYALKNS